MQNTPPEQRVGSIDWIGTVGQDVVDVGDALVGPAGQREPDAQHRVGVALSRSAATAGIGAG